MQQPPAEPEKKEDQPLPPEAQAKVDTEAERQARRKRFRMKYGSSDRIHSFSHGFLDPNDRYHKQFIDP
ncbi:MAG: hypothetical protein Q8L64_03510 [bacterium]|nr:hypothetical protein [bacterium]